MRGEVRRAGYGLSIAPNIQIGVIEASGNTYGVGDRMQPALENARHDAIHAL